MKPSRFIFRTDGNCAIGLGHVMRTLSLAEVLRERGAIVSFAVGPTSQAACTNITRRDFCVEMVEGEMHDASKVSQLAKLALADSPPAAVVIDTPYLTDRSEALLTDQHIWTATLDDQAQRPIRSQLVVNPNPGADQVRYSAPEAALIVGGIQYAIIRPEFKGFREPSKNSKKPLNLLITFGGSDPTNSTCRILNALPLTNDLKVTVLFGPLMQRRPETDWVVKTLQMRGVDVHVKHDPANLGSFFSNHDMAITAAGTTMLELAYLGMPMLAFSVVDNQQRGLAWMAERKLVVSGGHLPSLASSHVSTMVGAFLQSTNRHHALSQTCLNTVDGHGPQRIADLLLNVPLAQQGIPQ